MSLATAPLLRICELPGCGLELSVFAPPVQRYHSVVCANQARAKTRCQTAPPGTFGYLMEEYRLRTTHSRRSLSLAVGVDPSYLSRIAYGQREPPARAIVDAIARALKLSAFERARLLVAGGYSPVDDWSETMQAVSEVLADQRIPEGEREEFGRVIQSIAERWGRCR